MTTALGRHDLVMGVPGATGSGRFGTGSSPLRLSARTSTTIYPKQWRRRSGVGSLCAGLSGIYTRKPVVTVLSLYTTLH